MLHPRVVRAASAFPYTDWIANAIRGVKYEGEGDRAAFLGSMLVHGVTGLLLRHADVVVPVPMFPGRERERGYNQVALMADTACRQLAIAPPLPVLVQEVERPSQVGLGATERRVNVRDSFSLNPELSPRHGLRYVLIDDVRTTGSTLLACSEALRILRPGRLDIVTLAAEMSADAMRYIESSRDP